MGYTHYWTQKRNFTIPQWQEVIADLKTILNHAQHAEGIALANGMGFGGTHPEFTDDFVAFNGVGDDCHETFYLQRRRVLESWQSKKHLGWAFCKTARKPYDRVATACLAYLSTVTRREDPASHEPIIGSEVYYVSSDGDASDFLTGVNLARVALPRVANLIDIPMGVMQSDRWCGPWVRCESKTYEVRFCRDGYGYVLKPRSGESYRFESHRQMAAWLDRTKIARLRGWKVGGTGWGSYPSHEPDIWSASGAFDKTRNERIVKAQDLALRKLFPVPAENAHQPPAYARPGEMLAVKDDDIAYSINDLIAKVTS